MKNVTVVRSDNEGQDRDSRRNVIAFSALHLVMSLTDEELLDLAEECSAIVHTVNRERLLDAYHSLTPEEKGVLNDE